MPIKQFLLNNKNGIIVKLASFGARIVSIITPDKNGLFEDIVLGYDSVDEYMDDKLYMGCIVGRYANRISKGKISINRKTYFLSQNDSENTLHGGFQGFDKKIWNAEKDGNSVKMNYCSEDGEEGFPGKLSVAVTFELTESDELIIDYQAQTTKDTVVNLTHHTYFNLAGNTCSTVLDHFLTIHSDYITEIDSCLIPTDNFLEVKNTPFDFKTPKTIGSRISLNHPQLNLGNGFDHNWVLNKNPDELSKAAVLFEPTSGRTIEFFTTMPGLQVFTSNFGTENIPGKEGRFIKARSAVAIEPQFFPDSPNQHNFPSAILKSNEGYNHKTIYKFGIE
ncbi:MAG: aldose epimerase family protein [Bacteroidales bacterium]|jgi:aldose 1-epimerase|nr:aldose epimerase family protein [Bacteroidales bacterium]